MQLANYYLKKQKNLFEQLTVHSLRWQLTSF